MADQGHRELRRLFDLVLAAPQAQREAILEKECGGNPELKKRVRAMIDAAEDDKFLGAPTADVLPTAGFDAETAGAPSQAYAPARAVEQPGSEIGPYKLLQLIGEGGFGSVFMAEQEKPVARKVALKIIKLGMDTGQVVARFEQERQALAIMDHPNIAKVLDAGATETGRPFFVMELVKGSPITDYCDKNKLNIDDRLALFEQVCTAVQHAHTKGIIHRDIKPSNVLVSTSDGKPHAKVIDFGIAKATASKLTEKTLFTEHKQLIGTPEYMSPEQAEGSLDIDTRTDVYSLGVLLYELLTGSTPFTSRELRSAAFGELQRVIREVDPPRPSTRLSQSSETIAKVASLRHTEPRRLGAIVRGELDWIVMKALEKDRGRRYETASVLAADVHRYLSGEAVVAAPPSTVYRFRKFIRRNKGIVSAGSAVAAALLIGVVAFAWQAKVARDQRDIAVAAQIAEAEQRQLADEQRDRAVTAEGETKKRADELAQVSEFQSSMLSQIDPAEAGITLMSGIREKYVAALEENKVAEADRAARIDAFTRDLGQVNATDTAAEMIDRTILRPAVDAIDAKFNKQPLVDASLRGSLAMVYRVLGKYETGANLQAQALEAQRSLLGEDHPDTMMSTNNLGSMLHSQGRLEEAEARFREVFDRRRRVLGEEHTDTLMTMNNLGNFLRSQGKYDEAEPLLRVSLEASRRVLGNENRHTLISMNTYGYLLVDQGKFAEAEPYWKEAYETGVRVFGADDPDVIVWTNNMGGITGALGNREASEQYYRKGLEGCRLAHGDHHPLTLNCLSNVAGAVGASGRFAEAEAMYLEILEARRRQLGNTHPDTMYSVRSMGNILSRQGKLAEAESYLREGLAACRSAFGNEHPDTIGAISGFASHLSKNGDLEEAEALYREALALSLKIWNEDHPDRLIMLNNLGNLLNEQRRYEEGDAFIGQALEARRRVSGNDDPETLIAISNMARALQRREKLDEAEALFREAEAGFRRVVGTGHPNTMNAIRNTGGLLRDKGKLDEALPYLQEAAEGYERILGKDHAQSGGARYVLGRLLLEMARFSEAERELIEAVRALSVAQGVPQKNLDTCAEELVKLYEAWTDAEPDKGYAEKAAEWKAKLPPEASEPKE